MSLIYSWFVLALPAAGVALFLRVLPWPNWISRSIAAWPFQGKSLLDKPLSCAVCMGGWGTLLVLLYRSVIGAGYIGDPILAFLASTALVAALFHSVFPPRLELP